MNELYNQLPQEGKQVYDEVFIKTFNKTKSVGFSEKVAVEFVKTKLKLIDGKFVALSENFITPKIYSFNMSNCESKVVMNSENEEFVMEAVLATTDRNTEGKYFTSEELNSISEQINLLGSTLPDVDHEKLNSLVQKYGNNYEAIKAEIAKEKGVFKTIRSALKDGKLWIQAVLDKRYKNVVKNFTSLSVEALADAGDDGRLKNPKYLGFTFTNNPKLKAARIAQ